MNDESSRKLLIADDQPVIRRLLRMTFAAENIQIFEADNGDSCIEIAQRIIPDLLILDLVMPGGRDGLQVSMQLKKIAELQHTQIILLTGRRDLITPDMAAVGVDHVMTKPFSPIELLKTVRDMLGIGAPLEVAYAGHPKEMTPRQEKRVAAVSI